jgi:beta-phosphoglucomutase-like phosphatase (HAD superfamily)
VDDFLTAAAGHAAGLRVIDVPNGQHGFDCLDHTEESRTAVTAALEAVHGALTI